MAMRDVADNREGTSKQAVGEFQFAVQNGFANTGTADWLAVENDAGDNMDFYAVRCTTFA